MYMNDTNVFISQKELFSLYNHAGSPDTQGQGLPFRIPRSLAERFPEKNNAVIRQFIPSPQETVILPYESPDPLSEQTFRKMPWLVHQYNSRVLIRATDQCAAYCRFCYRRAIQTQVSGFLSNTEIANLCEYIQGHKSIREILISGGDPLFGTDTWLYKLLSGIRTASKQSIIRICTRIPIVLPERITDSLLATLKEFGPLVFVVHCNHADELDKQSRTALDTIRQHGFYVVSQTVLLKSINDSVSALINLFTELYRLGILPYYLFQGDLTQGTSHFRTPLSKGLSLYNELRKNLSGIELPRYAVDAPGGLGKIYLPEGCTQNGDGNWFLKTPDGKTALYPEE